jgi:hypothetical protein
MVVREKLHADKYKEIRNDWNYDASCTLTSLTIWVFENFKRLMFVAQSVPSQSVEWFECITSRFGIALFGVRVVTVRNVFLFASF